MENNRNILCSDVLKRLCATLNVESDVELAKALGVANNTISGWRTRNKIPFEKVLEVAVNKGVTTDSIFFGDTIPVTNNEIDKKRIEDILFQLKRSHRLYEQPIVSVATRQVVEVYNAVCHLSDRSEASISIDKAIGLMHSSLNEAFMETMKKAEEELENNNTFQSTQNFNAPVGQASGRDIVNKDKGK